MRTLYDNLQVLEPRQDSFTRAERLKAMNRPLLAWYDTYARCLPWREDPGPYRVWISEIMLQQTRVEAVKPYFERFMKELPTVEALAGVPEERLLKLWEGLGYYNRAKNLKRAAEIIVEQYGGKLPDSYDKLKELPGIGSYTAGAIASIAYGLPYPAVDGNVLRVVSRVTGSREDILKQSVKSQMECDLKQSMPQKEASHFNQGLIEIGAMVCVPNGSPHCEDCPLQSVCLAAKLDLTREIPVKTQKKARRIEQRTILLVEYGDQIAIHKRADKGLLPSLYEFPNLENQIDIKEVLHLFEAAPASVEVLPAAKHIFSHVEWHMTGYRVSLSHPIPEMWISVSKQALRDQYPLPNAFRAYMKLIK